MNHIMLDLETLSTRTDARVLQIGAVRFNPDEGEVYIDGGFSATVRDTIGHVDLDTVKWWLDSGSGALGDMLSTGDSYPLYDALHDLRIWLLKGPIENLHVWSNGANFDGVILRQKFGFHGIPCPWKFYQEHCHRTLVKHAVRRGYVRDKVSVPHQALDDAILQATENIMAHKYLRGHE